MDMKRKQILAAVLFSLIFTAAALASPRAFAGWEPEGAASERAAITTAAEKEADDDETETFRDEVLRLVNTEREDNGLPALEQMQELTDMADMRAWESSIFFLHTRPDGSKCSTIFSERNMEYSAAGENLSGGFSSPEKLVAAWMGSESHSANILSEKYTYLGVGVYVDGKGRVYCSQLFYTPVSVSCSIPAD